MERSWRIPLSGPGNIQIDISMAEAFQDCGAASRDKMTITVENLPGVGADIRIAMRYGKKEPSAVGEVLSFAQYVSAEPGTTVTVACFVQGCEVGADGTVTIFGQDADGGYYICAISCDPQTAKQLRPGTSIRVTAQKQENSLGSIYLKGGSLQVQSGFWLAPAVDITQSLGAGDMSRYQYKLVRLRNLAILSSEYFRDDGVYYFRLRHGQRNCEAAVVGTMVGRDSETYRMAQQLVPGDRIDITAFFHGKTDYGTWLFTATALSEAKGQ